MSKKKQGWNIWANLKYNLSKEGLKEFKEYDKKFTKAHDKAHGIGKYSKKRKKK